MRSRGCSEIEEPNTPTMIVVEVAACAVGFLDAVGAGPKQIEPIRLSMKFLARSSQISAVLTPRCVPYRAKPFSYPVARTPGNAWPQIALLSMCLRATPGNAAAIRRPAHAGWPTYIRARAKSRSERPRDLPYALTPSKGGIVAASPCRVPGFRSSRHRSCVPLLHPRYKIIPRAPDGENGTPHGNGSSSRATPREYSIRR